MAEIPSTHDGIVRKLHYSVDDVCQVGHVLADIELEDGSTATVDIKAAVSAHETTTKVENHTVSQQQSSAPRAERLTSPGN